MKECNYIKYLHYNVLHYRYIISLIKSHVPMNREVVLNYEYLQLVVM